LFVTTTRVRSSLPPPHSAHSTLPSLPAGRSSTSITLCAITYLVLMWASKILSSIGMAPSSRSISGASSQLHFRRTFSVIATADRGNSEAKSRGAYHFLPGNRLNLAGPILTSIDSMSENCKYGLAFHGTRRFMSKYLSKSATKRLPLTTKRAGKGYYKGKGCTSEGRLTSKGKFIADPSKKLQLIVPDLRGFALKPYISRTVAKSPPKDQLSLGAGQ
jgi:large subunit ribosomal protein L41